MRDANVTYLFRQFVLLVRDARDPDLLAAHPQTYKTMENAQRARQTTQRWIDELGLGSVLTLDIEERGVTNHD